MARKQADADGAATLAEIKRLYDGDDLTVAQIGERFGRSAAGISRLARTNNWTMRWERLGRLPYKRQGRLPKAREIVTLRFYRTISRKLEEMEMGVANGTLSPEDFERVAKSLRSMLGGVENVEKVAAAGAHADKEPTLNAIAPDTTAEAERISREIMERFERIQRRRSAEGASG